MKIGDLVRIDNSEYHVFPSSGKYPDSNTISTSLKNLCYPIGIVYDTYDKNDKFFIYVFDKKEFIYTSYRWVNHLK